MGSQSRAPKHQADRRQQAAVDALLAALRALVAVSARSIAQSSEVTLPQSSLAERVL